MRSELRKRFVNSVEYLRRMDFFKDYSDLSSEEILKKIFNGEIDHSSSWWDEKRKSKIGRPHGVILRESLMEHEKDWIKSSDARIDRALIVFDAKRVVEEAIETWLNDEIGVAILKRLARISRGIFQPTNISGKWIIPLEYKWAVEEVSFDFKGKRRSIRMVLRYDYIMDIGLEELNEIIKDTGYQYYEVSSNPMIIVVLTEEEAKKLEKERGWIYIPL
ncbi:MAG: hypothetical protein ACP5PQ_06300 [Thermoproteota archaeon]